MSSLRPSGFCIQHSAFSIQHCLLLSLALCPYFVDLGGSSIWDANEAFYVETPREMMERGDYVNPRFNYEPRINKPVLSYWIVAGFYKAFGVSVGVQRIPIAIGGIVLIADGVLPGARGVSLGTLDHGGVVGGRRPGCLPAPPHVLAAHLHRHLHLDVHGADAAVLRAVRALSGASAPVPRADVRQRRSRRADERAGGGPAARAGFWRSTSSCTAS